LTESYQDWLNITSKYIREASFSLQVTLMDINIL
jgi:hypothetical protein